MTFQQAIAYLDSLAPRGWRMGLDRMEEFVRRADLESAIRGDRAPRFLHVTGTNGKGSVTAFMEAILTAQGVRVGGFYSPFVYDPCERITVRCQKIAPEVFARRIEALIPAGESLVDTDFGGVTEFEVKTAAGLLHWREEACDWVALEVGLGGRLDATNVVEGAVATIVSIGLDHTSILGESLEEIAFEKAGIVKHGRPVVIGDMPAAASGVIAAEASKKKAPLWRFGSDFRLEQTAESFWSVSLGAKKFERLEPGFRGARAPHNLAVAIAALIAGGCELEDDAVRQGAAQAALPGRMQSVFWNGVEVLLDGAHNYDAARVLAEGLAMRYSGRRVALVLGMTRGHDPRQFLTALDQVDTVHVAPIAFHRALAPGDIVAELKGRCVTVHPSVRSALEAAALEAGGSGLVVVTGSFYLVGEAGTVLGLNPPRAVTVGIDNPR